MKKAIFLIILFAFSSICLFAGGSQEEAIWFSAANGGGSNGNYFDLLTTNNDAYIGLVGNTKNFAANVFIEQNDSVSGGDNDPLSFYFINENNVTSIHKFTMKYQSTRYAVGTTLQNILKEETLSEHDVYNSSSRSFELSYSTGRERYGWGTWPCEYFDVASLKISYNSPDDIGDLEPGLYYCNLKIVVKRKSDSSVVETFHVKLQAQYLASSEVESTSGYFTGFSLDITPTPVSYNFDIKQYRGVPQEIADVTFYYSHVGSSTKSYSGSPISIAISADANQYTAVNGSTDFRFVKTNIQNQEISSGNSIAYRLSFSNGTTTKTSPTELKFDTTVVDKNTQLMGGYFSGKQYLNSFKFTGTVSITVDNVSDEDLPESGRYSTTIYYYVISNY